MTNRVLPLLLSALLAACWSKSVAFEVKAPSSMVVTYRSGHNLFPGHYPVVELRTADGLVVQPADVETTWVELHTTTKYYVLAPGTYRLVNDRDPQIKTLRQQPPRLVNGDRVTSDLDASTDSNDDRGNTTESWRIVPSHSRRYFVLVEEVAPRSTDDLRVLVLDPNIGSGSRRFDHVNGAKWVGPFRGPTTLQLHTYGTRARRYSLRVSEAGEEEHEVRTVPVGTIVSGRLGPGHSSWADVDRTAVTGGWIVQNAWVDRLRFTSDRDQLLYVAVSWTADSAHLQAPVVTVVDDAGQRVETRTRLRRDSGPYPYVDTFVYATTRPYRGTLHLRISGQPRDLTSGRYDVCVAADAKTCEDGTAAKGRTRVF